MGQQVGGEGITTPSPSFDRVSRPSPTTGAGTPDSEFGGWGVAGVPESALARLLAP